MKSLQAFFLVVPLLAAWLAGAQSKPAALPQSLTAAEQWQVAAQIRAVASLSTEGDVLIDGLAPSEVPGYQELHFHYTNKGQADQPGVLLLSLDHKSLAEFRKFDTASKLPTAADLAGRPSRNGPASAPVTVVFFDDLECPFCARLNSYLPTTLRERYGEKVRIVYMDFPIEGHPWAEHAAIDVACLRQQSESGYWKAIDSIHEKAGLVSSTKEIEQSYKAVDQMTVYAGVEEAVDGARLETCILKQDRSLVASSRAVGQRLGVSQTPTFYINGARVQGAASKEFIFSLVDKALQAK